MTQTTKLVSTLLLAIALAAPLAAAEADRSEQVHKKVLAMFAEMDKDHDGNVSRDEFAGNDKNFDRYDLDFDGILTPHETERAMLDPQKLDDRVLALDANGDGSVSRDEWKGDAATFARLDKNQDGAINSDDRHGKRESNSADQAKRFAAMDLNRDGQLTREEWRGTDRTFAEADANGDGLLTVDEVTGNKNQ